MRKFILFLAFIIAPITFCAQNLLSEVLRDCNYLDNLDLNAEQELHKRIEIEKVQRKIYSEQSFEIDNFSYKILSEEDNTVELTLYRSALYNVFISPTVIYNQKKYTVVSIGYSAFSYDDYIQYVNIPNTVTNIGANAFCFCPSLESVFIANSVISIGRHAFYSCRSLTSVFIPSSVEDIMLQAFAACSSLISIIVDSNNSHYSSVDGILYNKDQTRLLRYPEGKELTHFNIPSFVKIIDHDAFWNVENLKSVTIPYSVKEIGEMAFGYCKGLKSIDIPYSVKKMDRHAFYECVSLESIFIPPLVESVQYCVFCGCVSLKKISVASDFPPFIDEYSFSRVDKQNCVLEVPIGASMNYKRNKYWNEFDIINEVDFSSGSDIYNTTDIKIFNTENQLIIEGVNNGELVQIYTQLGSLVYSNKSSGDKMIISIEKNTIYIVKLEGQSTKVLIL